MKNNIFTNKIKTRQKKLIYSSKNYYNYSTEDNYPYEVRKENKKCVNNMPFLICTEGSIF